MLDKSDRDRRPDGLKRASISTGLASNLACFVSWLTYPALKTKNTKILCCQGNLELSTKWKFARKTFYIQTKMLIWWLDWLDVVASIPHLCAHGQLFLADNLLRHLFGNKGPRSGTCIYYDLLENIRGGFTNTYVYPKAWLGPTGFKPSYRDQSPYQMTSVQSRPPSW